MFRNRLTRGCLGTAAIVTFVVPLSSATAAITARGGSVHGEASSTLLDQSNDTGRLSDPLLDFGKEIGIAPNADLPELEGTTVKNHFSAVALWNDSTSGNIRFSALTALISNNNASLQTAQASYDVQWLYEVKFDTNTKLNLDFFENATNSLNAPDHAEFDYFQDTGTFNTIWDSGSGNGSLTKEFEPGTYKFIFSATGTIADLLDTNYSSFIGVQLDWKFTEDQPDDGAVPEPVSWLMMLCGFGATGGMIRASRRKTRIAFG